MGKIRFWEGPGFSRAITTSTDIGLQPLRELPKRPGGDERSGNRVAEMRVPHISRVFEMWVSEAGDILKIKQPHVSALVRNRCPSFSVGHLTFLSSRAEKDRPLADDLAESRDPAFADTGKEIEGSSLQELCSGGCIVGMPLGSKSRRRGTSGSFDSVNGLASESIHSAQDDNIKKRKTTNDDEVLALLLHQGSS